jgi:endonuclease-3
MVDLLSLPGVARKTANVVLGVGYGIADGIVVDTHVARLSHRLGLSRGKNAEVIERDLIRVVPREEWILLPHLLIFHGRRICVARKPKCDICPLATLCPSAPYFLAGKAPPWERGRGEAKGRPVAKKRATAKKRPAAKKRVAPKKRAAAKKRAPARRKAK